MFYKKWIRVVKFSSKIFKVEIKIKTQFFKLQKMNF